MVNIIPKVPGFGERLGAALGGGLGGGFQQGMSKAQEFAEKMQLQKAKLKEDKTLEKENTLQSLKGTVAQLREMADSDVPGIGRFGQLSQSSEALYNRSKLQTLGSDLLSFYKTLFPRGITQQEFIRLEKDYIPKPGDATSTMKGKLDAFDDLIDRKLKEIGGSGEKEEGKREEEFVSVRSPKGKIKKIPKGQLQAAIQAGGEEV